MKKILCVALAVLILLPVVSVTAFAHRHGGHGHSSHPRSFRHSQNAHLNHTQQSHDGICESKCSYADTDGDNICDNCENRCADCGETKDQDCDGICDNCGKCSHYADENKDGACDHQAACADRKKAFCKSAGKNSHHGGNHGICH